jgi:Tfp pilus assembly major pilin PilA
MKTKSAFTIIELLTVIFTIAAVCAGLAQPYYESKAYNALTGANTTYWDAVWLELRVQDQPVKSIKD